MFDPFLADDPPVLVHEVDGPDFERAWAGAEAEPGAVTCPVCHDGTAREIGVSQAKNRAWLRFSCGDVVTQEITAG